MLQEISKDTPIDELVCEYPDSVRILMERGIKCLACGEPIWGTLASAAEEKGFSPQQTAELVEEINRLFVGHEKER